MEIKKRIVTKATELFMREGVRRVTMDNLAASLGMSKRTIYEIYSNKDEILKECIETHISYQKIAIKELADKSETIVHFFISLLSIGIENVKSNNPQFINDVKVYYPKIWDSTLCANEQYNNEQTSLYLQRGIKEGVIRDDINIPFISKLIMEFFVLLANNDIFPHHIYTPAIMYEQTILTLIRGIASTQGIAIIDELMKNKTAINK